MSITKLIFKKISIKKTFRRCWFKVLMVVVSLRKIT